MKIILEANDKVMLKLLNQLKLKFRRNGIKYMKYVEPINRTRKEKQIKVIEEINEIPISDEKKEVKKRNPRTKKKVNN